MISKESRANEECEIIHSMKKKLNEIISSSEIVEYSFPERDLPATLMTISNMVDKLYSNYMSEISSRNNGKVSNNHITNKTIKIRSGSSPKFILLNPVLIEDENRKGDDKENKYSKKEIRLFQSNSSHSSPDVPLVNKMTHLI